MVSIVAKSDSSWVRMDWMAGVRSEGEMEVNWGRVFELRRGFSVTVDILRVERGREAGVVVVVVERKARAWLRWARRVARASETIFIGGRCVSFSTSFLQWKNYL